MRQMAVKLRGKRLLEFIWKTRNKQEHFNCDINLRYDTSFKVHEGFNYQISVAQSTFGGPLSC